MTLLVREDRSFCRKEVGTTVHFAFRSDASPVPLTIKCSRVRMARRPPAAYATFLVADVFAAARGMAEDVMERCQRALIAVAVRLGNG